MSDLTLQELFLADSYEREIDGIKAGNRKKKREFIAWLNKEAELSAHGLSCGTLYISEVISKAKEML